MFFLPIKQFVGQSVALDLEVLVEPTGGTPGIPARLRKRMADPREIPLDAAGFINFSAAFSVGIGNYRANWRVSDDAGRSCQGQWDFKANQSRGNRNVDLALRPGQIVDPAIQVFRDEPLIERPHLPTPRRLKIFISLDVVGRRGRLVRTRLTHVLPHFSALRQLVRSLHFNQFALVVFSFEDRSVLVRQDYGETLDFKPLGGVVDRLQPATVDLRQLARGSELRFFERFALGRAGEFGETGRGGLHRPGLELRSALAGRSHPPVSDAGYIGGLLRCLAIRLAWCDRQLRTKHEWQGIPTA